MNDSYAGVILAAGRGRRMGVLGEHYPKALLPIANQPLIDYQLDFLRGLGIQDVFIVVGFRTPELIEKIGYGDKYGMRLTYVEQEAPLGSAHALGYLRNRIRTPFVLLLGDYFFSATDPDRIVDRLRRGQAAIAAKREPEARLIAEACALQVDERGRVVEIIEKPAAPASDLKGCGFYAFQPEFFDAVARTPRTALRDEYELSVSLELYLAANKPLYAEEVIVWDTNMTRPEDLLECNLKMLAQLKVRQLLGEDVCIPAETVLDNVVIGDRAQITAASNLKDVVVFPGARVDRGGSLERAIVTSEMYISCPSLH